MPRSNASIRPVRAAWYVQNEMQADCIAGSLLADANVAGRIHVSTDDPDQMHAP